MIINGRTLYTVKDVMNRTGYAKSTISMMHVKHGIGAVFLRCLVFTDQEILKMLSLLGKRRVRNVR